MGLLNIGLSFGFDLRMVCDSVERFREDTVRFERHN
jgi:hypothetical protein